MPISEPFGGPPSHTYMRTALRKSRPLHASPIIRVKSPPRNVGRISRAAPYQKPIFFLGLCGAMHFPAAPNLLATPHDGQTAFLFAVAARNPHLMYGAASSTIAL